MLHQESANIQSDNCSRISRVSQGLEKNYIVANTLFILYHSYNRIFKSFLVQCTVSWCYFPGCRRCWVYLDITEKPPVHATFSDFSKKNFHEMEREETYDHSIHLALSFYFQLQRGVNIMADGNFVRFPFSTSKLIGKKTNMNSSCHN